MEDTAQFKACASLSDRLGHHFQDPGLLLQALTHPSYAFEHNTPGKDYQRLEYLGDAVIDLMVGDMLFRRFPAWSEGDLTASRAALVNQASLAALAREISLGSYLRLGRGEMASGGRDKPYILACAFEAVVGALYLDAGFQQAAQTVTSLFAPLLDDPAFLSRTTSPKSALQENLQARFGEQPSYHIDKSEGPDHDRVFTASVRFRGKVLAQGRAGSKKEAEQQAAAEALKNLDSTSSE